MLERLKSYFSFDKVRVQNFRLCVEDDPSVPLVDVQKRRSAVSVTIHVNRTDRVSDVFIRLLNTNAVSISDLYGEDDEVYLKVRVT